MNNSMETELQDGAMRSVMDEAHGAGEISLAQHVKRWQCSGMSKRHYTQAHGLNYWAFRRACREQGAIVTRPSQQAGASVAMPMVEIALRKPAEEGLEVELANGIRVHLRGTRAGLVMEKLLGSLS